MTSYLCYGPKQTACLESLIWYRIAGFLVEDPTLSCRSTTVHFMILWIDKRKKVNKNFSNTIYVDKKMQCKRQRLRRVDFALVWKWVAFGC